MNKRIEEYNELLHRIVESGFSKKVISECIDEANQLGADSKFMDMLYNAMPMCE